MKSRKFTIGRDPSCHITIGDATVSGRHAELTEMGKGKWLLTDCKSRNGTFRIHRDGQKTPIRQELVSPLDQLCFGEVTLIMRELLESLRLAHLRLDAQDAQRCPRPPEPLTPSGDLERCHCGAIKAVNKPCPMCQR